MQLVEEAGCHVLLTDAVVLLSQAREKVADFVDGHGQEERIITEGEWKSAKEHFDHVRQAYQDMEGRRGVNTTLALRACFDPLARRFNQGERTPELYDEMRSVE